MPLCSPPFLQAASLDDNSSYMAQEQEGARRHDRTACDGRGWRLLVNDHHRGAVIAPASCVYCFFFVLFFFVSPVGAGPDECLSESHTPLKRPLQQVCLETTQLFWVVPPVFSPEKTCSHASFKAIYHGMCISVRRWHLGPSEMLAPAGRQM